MKKLLLLSLALFIAAIPAASYAADENEAPVPIRTVKPDTPKELEETDAVVIIKCTVDAAGNVTDPTVTKTTDARFDPLAVESIKKWKFKPGKKAGVATPMAVQIPFKFSKRD